MGRVSYRSLGRGGTHSGLAATVGRVLACLCAGFCVFLIYAAVDSRAGPVPRPLAAPKCWPARPRSSRAATSDDTSTDDAALTIVSITAGLDARYSKCMNGNRRSYAHRHGYTYCEFDAPLVAHRSFGFHKLVALRHLLLRVAPGARVWYMDADALIMNQSIAIDALLHGYTEDIVWTSEAEGAGKEDALRRMVGVTLGLPAGLVTETETKWAIQGGSFVMRNTPWALEIMDTVYRESGSMLLPRPPPSIVPWSMLSDRAQWIRWAYLHPQEARKHMTILPGRSFNSMGTDYAVGDFVRHAGGGGAFENQYFRNPFKTDNKYVQLLALCNALHSHQHEHV